MHNGAIHLFPLQQAHCLSMAHEPQVFGDGAIDGVRVADRASQVGGERLFGLLGGERSPDTRAGPACRRGRRNSLAKPSNDGTTCCGARPKIRYSSSDHRSSRNPHPLSFATRKRARPPPPTVRKRTETRREEEPGAVRRRVLDHHRIAPSQPWSLWTGGTRIFTPRLHALGKPLDPPAFYPPPNSLQARNE